MNAKNLNGLVAAMAVLAVAGATWYAFDARKETAELRRELEAATNALAAKPSAPAFIIARVHALDENGMQVYRERTPGVVTKYGGQFVGAGQTVVLEDPQDDEHTNPVVVKFADMDKLKAFWDSPEYSELKALRQKSSNVFAIAVSAD